MSTPPTLSQRFRVSWRPYNNRIVDNSVKFRVFECLEAMNIQTKLAPGKLLKVAVLLHVIDKHPSTFALVFLCNWKTLLLLALQ